VKSKSNRPPRRHHYLPQFYLKRWAVDGCLVEFKKRNPGSDTVSSKKKAPAGTGWKPDLYSFEGVPSPQREAIEAKFLRMLDGSAAEALAKIEDNLEVVEARLRQAWSTFLLSLNMRHPDDIDAFKFVYKRDLSIIHPQEEREYQSLRTENEPATFYEWIDDKVHVNDLALEELQRLFLNRKATTELMNMFWTTATVQSSAHVLTSDRPTIRSFLGHRESHWILPIGPRKIFIACNDHSLALKFKRKIELQVWKDINRTILNQASSLAFSDTEKHLPFIQKHLATKTKQSLFHSFVPNPFEAPPLETPP
jgi:hypothetical protein